jgi:hypothetical protein
MKDEQILDLYWKRSEMAISETEKKYGRYCYSIAYQILSDEEKRLSYMDELRPILLAAAESADGVVAAYLHFNPEITPPDTGLFFAREDVRGAMLPQEPTDFSKVDIEKQEWYS